MKGGEDGVRVWVQPGMALHRLLAQCAQNPSPATWMMVPHAARTWDAAEIVYNLQSLVLLEDRQ